MVQVRKAESRGRSQLDWLKSYHTFSFAEYFDEAHMGFRALRVINDDEVAPGRGFGTHAHKDMEILTYILSGTLEHRDSMGNGAQIRPGEVQRMTAGSGITHSELNPSSDTPVHLLQIWVLPEDKNLKPSYEQKLFSEADKAGRLKLIASREGRDGSVLLHQDVNLFACGLAPTQSTVFHNKAERFAWVQITQGKLTLNGLPLNAGDGVAVSGEETLRFAAPTASEFLLFDLA
jgi:redox-sensitive bicupin YhaK (pirin superfamily)